MSSVGWQRDLLVNQNEIGDVLLLECRLDEALSAFRASLALAERLAAVDPSNTTWQRDLSASQFKIGDVLMAQARLDEALSAFRDGLAVGERRAAIDPRRGGMAASPRNALTLSTPTIDTLSRIRIIVCYRR